jgi:hypothetical protein
MKQLLLVIPNLPGEERFNCPVRLRITAHQLNVESLWRSAELTHLCSTKLTQWFKAGGGAFSFQVVESVAV